MVKIGILDAIVIIVLLYSILVLFVFPPGSFFSPDEGYRLWQMLNVRLEGGRLDLSFLYPGQDIDPDFSYLPLPADWFSVREGQVYLTRWLPLFPLLSWPFYKLLGLAGLHIIPILSTALLLYLAYLLARRLEQRTEQRAGRWAKLSIPLIGLGTPLLIYSLLFWEHTLATALALLSVWLVVKQVETGRWWFLLPAALSIAGTLALRPEMSLFALVVVVAYLVTIPLAAWRGRTARSLVFIGGLSSFAFLGLIYFVEGRETSLGDYVMSWEMHLYPNPPQILADSLVGLGPALWIRLVFLLAATAFVLLSLHPGLKRAALPLVAAVFLALSGLLCLPFLSHGKINFGLLGISPFVLFAFYDVPQTFAQSDRAGRFVALIAWLYAAVYLFLIVFSAGGQGFAFMLGGNANWGLRYALTVYPLLAVVALGRIDKVPGAFGSVSHLPKLSPLVVCFLMLALLGVVFQLEGLRAVYLDKTSSAIFNAALKDIPEEHIVTDQWWVALETATQFYDKKMFLLSDEPHSLERWVALAGEKGVDDFAYVGREALDGEVLARSSLSMVETVPAAGFVISRVAVRR